jgi:hypothetical protein
MLAKCYLARLDLLDQPLFDPDLTLFMDRSYSPRRELDKQGQL